MGIDALQSNGITKKLLYFIQDKQFTLRNDPLRRVRKSRILLFVSIQLVAFGATFAVTQSIGILFSNIRILFFPNASRSCYWVPHNHHASDTSTGSGNYPVAVQRRRAGHPR